MFRIRTFEERGLQLRKEELAQGSMHFCAGQEAVPVGACSVLRPDDAVVATYRGHGWALARGVPMPELMAELCHRATGINGGRGGSAYLSDPAHGFVGENSIVGAGVPIAGGVALAGTLRGSQRVVLVSIGDGATSQGATHEALTFAVTKRLPVVVMCENNGWSEMTAISEIVPFEDLARRADGYGLPGETVDGCDPEAVRAVTAEAVERARSGGGPTLIECKAVRLWGHYNADIEHYRPKADREAAAARDPLPALRARLLATGESTEEQLAEIEADVEHEVATAESFARSSPMPDPATARDHVTATVEVRPPAVARADDGEEEITYVKAVTAALQAELEARPELLLFGEDVGAAGGIFGASRGLQQTFGAERVFDTPIAESAILGAAVGLAAEGLRPVAEIMWADFLLVALDQLVNQAANARYISEGRTSLPLVVRTQQGITPGSCAQHSQSLEALLAHIPGLRVGLPATPQDAYSMLRAAIADDDPCVIIEARGLYQHKGTLTHVPDPCAGGARRWSDGDDLTLITWGQTLQTVLDAAAQLDARGVACTVLDLRWLSPLDDAALAEAVERTGRAVIVHEANVTGGFGAEVAARITETLFDHLDAPITRIGLPDVRVPASPVLQAALTPSVESIIAAALDPSEAAERVA